MGFFFQRIQERVRNNQGKRAIRIRATEGLLNKGRISLMNILVYHAGDNNTIFKDKLKST